MAFSVSNLFCSSVRILRGIAGEPTMTKQQIFEALLEAWLSNEIALIEECCNNIFQETEKAKREAAQMLEKYKNAPLDNGDQL